MEKNLGAEFGAGTVYVNTGQPLATEVDAAFGGLRMELNADPDARARLNQILAGELTILRDSVQTEGDL